MLPSNIPSDNCRLCKASFKVKFGNLGKQSHSSSENLFKPSKRQDCFAVQLSEICSQVGLPLLQDSLRFSDRVCNPCGRKIRNLGQLYKFVKAANTSLTGTLIQRSKRTLATLEKASPSWRKSKSVRVNSPVLQFVDRHQSISSRPHQSDSVRGRTAFLKKTKLPAGIFFLPLPLPRYFSFQPDSNSLGRFFVSPQASSDVESRMPLA